MPQESRFANDSLIPPQAPVTSAQRGWRETFDRIAAGLYSLASMLVGEGEDSARLVEAAIANGEVSACQDAEQARVSSRRALCGPALEILEQRNPGCLAAPQGLQAVATCIEDDDLDAAGVSSEELERMIAGPDRDRMRNWLASLPTELRTIFALRAVAGLTAAETAGILAEHGGLKAAGWTPDAVRELFRQALCSLTSQLIQATAAR
jgi:hypothetical protein